jgi:glutamine synthetase
MLDKKTPLLRSTEILSEQAVRVLHALGRNEVKRVVAHTGAEQEYFILDKETYLARRDLVFTGRTLFGAPAPKGQELDDHYFGVIKPRVKAFMEELDRELWRLGIFASTEHNEAAPSQHELAPVFSVTNLAADHNQLTMEIMKKVADRHGLVCLLHEKPFEGVNGSGKHNNWSVQTNTGVNLFKPGDDPYGNTVFLLFLAAVITAVTLGAQMKQPLAVSMLLLICFPLRFVLWIFIAATASSPAVEMHWFLTVIARDHNTSLSIKGRPLMAICLSREAGM